MNYFTSINKCVVLEIKLEGFCFDTTIHCYLSDGGESAGTFRVC